MIEAVNSGDVLHVFFYIFDIYRVITSAKAIFLKQRLKNSGLILLLSNLVFNFVQLLV